MTVKTDKKESDSMKTCRSFNILSLDGVGIRSVLQSVIIDRLRQEYYPKLIRDTDLIAGVSVSGVQALGLAAGFPVSESRKIYSEVTKYLFSDCCFNSNEWEEDKASNSNKKLKAFLKSLFGNKRLDDLDKKVAIVSFDLDNEVKSIYGLRTWRPKVFHNLAGYDSDNSELVVDIALRTTAMPLFFPTYQGYCDGSIVASNPAIAALTLVLGSRHVPEDKYGLENIKLFSLGAGKTSRHIRGKSLNWGLSRWSSQLLYLALEGQAQMSDFQCRVFLQQNYHRINPILGKPFSLYSWEKVSELIKVAENCDLTSAVAWLEERWF